MKRFMMDVDAEVATVALVVLTGEKAAELLRAKGVLDKANDSFGGKVSDLTIEDGTARFFEGCPGDVVDLFDELSNAGTDWIEIPDDKAADFSVPVELPRDNDRRATVTADGVWWSVSLQDGSEYRSETCVLSWDAIRSAASEAEPANNEGRVQCWWCGGRTRKMILLSSNTDFCDACGK